MPVIIDGYNLLHASGVFGPRRGPGDFEQSRLALLNLLANSLGVQEAEATTVVFDARDAPPNLPRTLVHRGITVRFAPRDREADDLIEELIEHDHAPRALIVVSSDRRVQRAARRRRATPVPSDRWLQDLLQQRRAQGRSTPGGKPQGPATAEEVGYWLEQFAGAESELEQPTAEPERPEVYNPFPPGYAEDLEE